MIKIDKQASVVEYGLARQIFWHLGYGANRGGDDLIIYETHGYTLFNKEGKNSLGIMSVDEGFFTYTLYNDGSLGTTAPWDEVVDYRALLSYIVKRVSPDYKPEPSPHIGHGRTQRHFIAQYHNELEKHKATLEEFELELV